MRHELWQGTRRGRLLSGRVRRLWGSRNRLRIDAAVFQPILAVHFGSCCLVRRSLAFAALVAALQGGAEQTAAMQFALRLAHDLQKVADLLLAHRFAVIIALGELAANRAKECHVFGCLDAFGNDLLVEFLREGDDRTDDSRTAALTSDR